MRGYILPPFEQLATPTPEEVKNRAKELYNKLKTVEKVAVSEKRPVVLEVYNEIKASSELLGDDVRDCFESITDEAVVPTNQDTTDFIHNKLLYVLNSVIVPPARRRLPDITDTPVRGGRKRSAISKKFNKCVKSVRKTVKARRGSDKESAAIAICTTSVLHPRKRTIKRYRKGRLVTQRRH